MGNSPGCSNSMGRVIHISGLRGGQLRVSETLSTRQKILKKELTLKTVSDPRIHAGFHALRVEVWNACDADGGKWLRGNCLFGMICNMRKTPARNRSAAKASSHERIVAAAARAIRRSGYHGAGVADIMKEAGLTHGAFYAHFDSREAMLALAADCAGAQANADAAKIVASAPAGDTFSALVCAYLSKEHVAGIETGCPIAALGSEIPRQSPEVRRVATRRIKEMVDLVARQSPDWGQPIAHQQALVSVATMVGTLTLARAVDDSALSEALCSASLNSLAMPKPTGAD